MPMVHLPVQSGSDGILAAMNRGHTRAGYLRVIDKLRAARADIAFTSDFIVGFPGETEADFADTLSLVDAVGFAGAYTFNYSPRPGTPAAEMASQVPDTDKTERLYRLQDLITRRQNVFNGSFVGQTLDVLLEKPGRLDGQLVGRSPYLQAVHVMADEAMIGEIVPVAITRLGANSLHGEIVNARATRDLAEAGA